MLKILKGLKELILGMGITGKHLGRHAVTLQYPEEKWDMPERSRGIVVLLSDKETGELNCTACMLCMRACPTAAIYIDAPRDENKKRQLKEFVVDNTLCCFCGMCEEACNFTAIKMAGMYEFSTYDKNDLIWDMNKLQEMGRDVPYEAKPKKKPVVKPKTETAPATENNDVSTEKPTETATDNPNEKTAEKPAGDDNKEGDA